MPLALTIAGPPGSVSFGSRTTVLPNGNIVVVDPRFTLADGTPDVGAVYLFRPDGTLVSALTGEVARSYVGSGGVTVLATGNYVIASPAWSTRTATYVGAATFASADTGVSGVVGDGNSLVGTTGGDSVGPVVPLANGNYVVASPNWSNGSLESAGAVTWANGRTGMTGIVDPANSLVGTSADDRVGSQVVALVNGNYVVASPLWNDGPVPDVGAVTFVDGATGATGAVGPANSLVGGQADDEIGERVSAAANGNYAVASPHWDNERAADAGAVTFCDGANGTRGAVGAGNSLVGSHAGDKIGSSGVAVLPLGNYVVYSPSWGDGATRLLGAATWVDGRNGMTGAVSAANSLVGSTSGDQVCMNGVAPLANGNYLVSSQFWRNGVITYAGAVTFGDGATGVAGAVSAANSLVGSTMNDSVTFTRALSNGNYVVFCPSCDIDGVVDAGAAVFGDGSRGTVGTIGAHNALVGSQTNDRVGNSVTALRNGNYVVHSSYWNNGSVIRAGAVTFGDGNVGVIGELSSANSLVGSNPYDSVGAAIVEPLANGNYVVIAPDWSNGSLRSVGAITLGDGAKGTCGTITSDNSLIGASPFDYAGRAGSGGDRGIVSFANGDFVVGSPHWHRNGMADVGATTYLSGSEPFSGTITAENSLLGVSANDLFGERLRRLPGDHFAVLAPAMDAETSDGTAVDAGAVVPGGPRGDATALNAVFGRHSQGGATMVVHANVDVIAIGRPADNEVSILHWPVSDRIFADGFDA